jgi:hypothetical protein
MLHESRSGPVKGTLRASAALRFSLSLRSTLDSPSLRCHTPAKDSRPRGPLPPRAGMRESVCKPAPANPAATSICSTAAPTSTTEVKSAWCPLSRRLEVECTRRLLRAGAHLGSRSTASSSKPGSTSTRPRTTPPPPLRQPPLAATEAAPARRSTGAERGQPPQRYEGRMMPRGSTFVTTTGPLRDAHRASSARRWYPCFLRLDGLTCTATGCLLGDRGHPPGATAQQRRGATDPTIPHRVTPTPYPLRCQHSSRALRCSPHRDTAV